MNTSPESVASTASASASASASVAQSLERSFSQHSNASARSYRSSTVRASKSRKLVSHSGSSASSIAASDKSLTSFPSFSGESPRANDSPDRLQTPTAPQTLASERPRHASATVSASTGASIVESLAGRRTTSRDALFEDAPPTARAVPGALHTADTQHIERLVARHGAVELVRMIAGDLAQRDAQLAAMRRRADDRERALRRIIRECGLSNLDLERRLKVVENELRSNSTTSHADEGLRDLMNDAMQDIGPAENSNSSYSSATVKASGRAQDRSQTGQTEAGKSTLKGWKDYLWGTNTSRKNSRASFLANESINPAAIGRSHSSLDRRPALQDDLFSPPDNNSVRSSSRASSIVSSQTTDRKASASLASLALRLVVGGGAEGRGRSVSNTSQPDSMRTASVASGRTANTTRSASVVGGPKALMAMRRTTNGPQNPGNTKAQAQELWGNMLNSPPSNTSARQESFGPVEMDAIIRPEDQPPSLTYIYNNYANDEFLTDGFGFIYDQRRKKRQREAAQMSRHIRSGSRTELLLNGRSGLSPNMLEDLPSPKESTFSEGRAESPVSFEDRGVEEGRPKRWQDYLKIATFPTELLSHTPSGSAAPLEITEAASETGLTTPENEPMRSPGITPTEAGLMPMASTTTAVDDTPTPSSLPPDAIPAGSSLSQDAEPVKLLLQQLREVHTSLQREKTVRWNDFLRKVRAERRREGQAALAAATAAAEARYERPAMILPETRVADGEIIGISDLGNKGKVGRAKWNEFKSLVLGGIPVAYRAKIWAECSGSTALRIPGYYEDLISQSGEEDDAIVVSQIDMDIRRTLTDNIFFRRGPGVQKLNEVLLAYSRRNKDVGYCQGMNLIAANLLLMMPTAEDAFWILTSIIETILPQGYYDHSLLSSRADQQVLRQYVSTVLPKLSAHLDSLSIELEALTFQWFLSVFTDCLCAEALFRVWDVVLCTNDGSTFLFQVALALLKLNEGNLLRCTTPAAVYTYINHQMTEHAISIDGLLQASEALRRVVRREEVELHRAKAIQAEKDMLAERDRQYNDRNNSNASTRDDGSKKNNEEDGGVKLGPEGESADEGELTVAEPRPME